MSDKIEEIRDRVEQDVAKGPANKEIYLVHKDRAFLLAEVENQRAENERLRADRRERIATAALQGMLASAELVAPPVHAGFIAKWAVVYADALIAKLDEEPQP